MHCEAVQNELGRGVIEPSLKEAIDSHLSACSSCRLAAGIYAQIDRKLKADGYWAPTANFAQKVAARASAGVEKAPRICATFPWTDYVYAMLLGGLTATTSLLAARILLQVTTSTTIHAALDNLSGMALANALPLAWASVAISFGISVWFIRRSLI